MNCAYAAHFAPHGRRWDSGPRDRMKNEIEAKFEHQEIIGETDPGGYQPGRFTRVKYMKRLIPHVLVENHR